jgi:hypothetical protein
MNERGWILKIEDGFRTKEMQTHEMTGTTTRATPSTIS